MQHVMLRLLPVMTRSAPPSRCASLSLSEWVLAFVCVCMHRALALSLIIQHPPVGRKDGVHSHASTALKHPAGRQPAQAQAIRT